MVDDRVSTEFPTNRGERAHHPRMKSEDESHELASGQSGITVPDQACIPGRYDVRSKRDREREEDDQ